MTKNCMTCGDRFEAKKSYATKCTKCWVKAKENTVWSEGYQAGFTAGRKAAPKPAPPFSEEFLFDCLKLCHPDRQPLERLALATRVSQEINALRDQLRKKNR